MKDDVLMRGFEFGVWEFPGDTMTSVDWSVTGSENGGTVLGSGTASGADLTDKFLSTNQYGYNIDVIDVSGLDVNLNAGTYWLNLQNAVVPSGDPVYWDENSGNGCGGSDGKGGGCPSQASESAVGTIPSEAFTIMAAAAPPGVRPNPAAFCCLAPGCSAWPVCCVASCSELRAAIWQAGVSRSGLVLCQRLRAYQRMSEISGSETCIRAWIQPCRHRFCGNWALAPSGGRLGANGGRRFCKLPTSPANAIRSTPIAGSRLAAAIGVPSASLGAGSSTPRSPRRPRRSG